MRVSVIINTIDRAQSLIKVLRALEAQEYDDFEVLVVVGPTKDETIQLLSAYQDRVRVLRCPVDTLTVSRNIGIQSAAGEIIAFIDDDALPSRRWLSQIVERFQTSPDLGVVGGTVYLCLPHRERIQYHAGRVSSLAEHVDVIFNSVWLPEHAGKRGLFWTARPMGTNMAFRRAALLEVGGFDEFIKYVVDESELTWRMAWRGWKVMLDENIIVYHAPASSRNRVVNTSTGRWYFETSAIVYFAIKNGRTVGEPWSRIFTRSVHQVHSHLKWYLDVYKRGEWSMREFAAMATREVAAFAHGAFAGLFIPRRLPSPDSVPKESPAMIRFKQVPNKRPLNVAITYSVYSPPGQDGVGRLVDVFARALSERGHNVHLIARSSAHEHVSLLDYGKLHRITYDLSRYGAFASLPKVYHNLNYSHAVYRKVRHLVMAEGIQVLISPVWLVEGLVTAVRKLVPTIAVVETAQGKLNQIHANTSSDDAKLFEMERLLLQHAHDVICISHAAEKLLQETYELNGLHTHLVYPGLATSNDDDLGTAEESASGLTVLFVGRLERRKGIQTLFEAIPAVLQRVPSAHFLIAGKDNSKNDGFYAAEGQTYPESFLRKFPQLSERVQFLGYVSEEELHKLYKRCDVFVAPSLFESFGFIFLEAMQHAKPVVSCRAGAIPEVVKHGETGILVEPGNSAELTSAITELLLNASKRRAMGSAGRQRLLSEFTLSRMADKLEESILYAIQRFQS